MPRPQPRPGWYSWWPIRAPILEVPILVPDGVNLGWTEGGLRYEMFCRASIPDAVCEAIIDSFVPLSTLLAS